MNDLIISYRQKNQSSIYIYIYIYIRFFARVTCDTTGSCCSVIRLACRGSSRNVQNLSYGMLYMVRF